MGMWGGPSAGGWSAQQGPGSRTSQLRKSTDGWDDDELGKLYDHQVMRRLVPYLRPYKRQTVIAILSMLVFAVASNIQPWLIGMAIDDYIPNGDLDGVAVLGGILIGLAAISWGAQWVQQVT